MLKESDFDDIRSYRDKDVDAVLKSMIRSRRELRMIRRFIFKGKNYIAGIVAGIYFRNWLKKISHDIKDSTDFQKKVTDKAVINLIEKSTDGASCSGIDRIKEGVGYFFISNHRDIVLDTAFLSHFLIANNLDTCHSAFGDNLIINKFTEHLMRINKGFIVKRNLPLREQFVSSKHLSAYINFLLDNNESVWIAQSDGRSKNGTDITKASVLKMLTFAKREKGKSSYDIIKDYKIAPVSVSYEIDPCDSKKAMELYTLSTESEYKKKRYEDLESMIRGFNGYKGRVHLAICEQIEIDPDDNEAAVSKKIDYAIHRNYRLWPTHYAAWDILNKSDRFKSHYDDKALSLLDDRMVNMEEDVKPFLLLQYANPVQNQIDEGVLK